MKQAKGALLLLLPRALLAFIAIALRFCRLPYFVCGGEKPGMIEEKGMSLLKVRSILLPPCSAPLR